MAKTNSPSPGLEGKANRALPFPRQLGSSSSSMPKKSEKKRSGVYSVIWGAEGRKRRGEESNPVLPGGPKKKGSGGGKISLRRYSGLTSANQRTPETLWRPGG